MKETALDDPESDSSYDAISYAWGDWTDSKVIQVNGKSVAVTRNLYDALLLFREDYSVERWLWADALCINQRDLNERGRQVAMMGEIFRRAQTVRVWLGLEKHFTKMCFDMFADFVPEPFGYIAVPSDDLLQSDHFYEGLLDLSERNWWKRVWVMQEVALASETIVHCGNITVDFRLLVLRLHIFWVSLLQTVAAPDEVAHSHRHKTSRSITRLAEFYTMCGDFLPFISVFRRASDLSLGEVEPRAVLEHLALISNMRATVPRDRIYGLLGLLPRSLGFSILVDYTSRPRSVYEYSAAEIMERSSSLDLLGLMEVTRTEDAVQNSSLIEALLPIWARRFISPPVIIDDQYSEEEKTALPSWVQKWSSPSTLFNPFFWLTTYEAAKDVPCLVKHVPLGKLVVRT